MQRALGRVPSVRPRMPRRKSAKPRTEAQQRAAAKAAETLRQHRFKPGQSGNPKGTNGRDWMKHAKEFWAAREASLMKGAGDKDGQVHRIDNVLASIHKSAMLGSFAQQEWAARVMGINPATKTEITGADGQPLGGPQVFFLMGDAGTREPVDEQTAEELRKMTADPEPDPEPDPVDGDDPQPDGEQQDEAGEEPEADPAPSEDR